MTANFEKNPELALKSGSLILITGSTGYIASHIVTEALALGYRVRGTVRSEEKAESTRKFFNNDNYAACIVTNMADPGAFKKAISGVDAVIHTASVTTFAPDPNEVIPATVAGATGLLEAASSEPSVKRFVYTSSSTAATIPKPGKKFRIDKDTWNTESVKEAWAPPPYEESRAFPVYAASKTQAEEAVWKFVKEHNPKFVVNCVLPNANIGKILIAGGATGDWVPSIYRGQIPGMFPARKCSLLLACLCRARSRDMIQLLISDTEYMVNVVDDARIHLAAAFDSSLSNERIYAFDSPYNWNKIMDAIKELKPDIKTLPERIQDEGEDLSDPDNQLGGELLKKWWGQEGENGRGWKGLLQSVKENLEGIM